MPAIDSCEPQIVKALAKRQWQVIDQPFSIRMIEDNRLIFADLRLHHTDDNQQIIVVEVKCFPENRPMLAEFYRAIGQYQIYRNALQLNQMDVPLYLAIPSHIYHKFFQTTLIQSATRDIQIKLIVVNTETEEVVLWNE